MIASQKLGILMPNKPMVVPRLSIHEFGREPAQTPSGIANNDRDEDRKNRQLDGRRQAVLYHADDRLGVFKGFAEIADGRRLEKPPVLHVQRLIQPPACFRLRDIRRVGLLAEQKQGRITGRGMDQGKHQQTDQKKTGIVPASRWTK